MKLICDQCGAKYSIADEKVRGKVFKIRCKKCQNVIVVRGTDQPTAEGGQAITQNDSAPAADQPSADAEPIWYVVIGREQVGPLTDGDLEGRLGSGEVTGDSFVWQEGFSDWVQLRTVDRFAALTGGGAPAAAAPAAEQPTAASPTNGAGAAAAGYDEQRAPSELDDEATQAVDSGSIPGFAEHQAQMAAAGAPAEPVPDQRDEATAIVNTAAAKEMAAAQDAEAAAGAGADLAAAGAGMAAAAAYGGDAGMTREGPAAAPFDAGGQLAAGMAGSIAAGGGNDLMSSTPVPGADGGGGNDGMFSAFDQPPPEDQAALDAGMVGARNENSVLFSLKNLQSLAMGQGADAGPAPPATDGQTDASGLIDVRALAGDVGRSGTPAAVSDLADDGVPLAPAAPVMIPMVRRRSNTPIIIGAVLGGCLILGLSAVVITLLLKDDDGKKATSSGKAVATAVSAKGKADKGDAKAGAAAPAEPKKDDKAAAKDSGKAKASKKAAAKKEVKEDKDDKDVLAAVTPKKKSAPKASARKAEPKKKEKAPKRTSGGDSDLGGLLDGLGGSSKKKTPKKAKKKEAPKPSPVKPKLSKKDIQKVVRSNGKRISRCATRIPGPPGQKVKIEMRWSIQPNGRVSGASVLTGKFKNHSVGRCVLSAVKAMRFPSHGGKPIKIGKYPFGLKK